MDASKLSKKKKNMALIRIPNTLNIPFVKLRWIPFALAIFLAFATAFTTLWKGFHYGVDFQGGVLVELKTPTAMPAESVRLLMQDQGEVMVQALGERDWLIRLDTSIGGRSEVMKKLKPLFPTGTEFRRIETIGPKVGSELIRQGVYAIFWALLAMLAYISWRFEWAFGLCALAALFHDCIAVLAFFSIGRFELTENAIVALLITAAYSINDTIVVFDRIRENRKTHPEWNWKTLIDRSINETLSRTLLTSSTTLIALGALYMWGGNVIASFSLPILWGIAFGTYSSICVAAPLLLFFYDKKKERVY